MSHVLFNKYFKSDIFNAENVKVIEKPSKQYHPSTLEKTNSDIFNINQKNIFENKIKNRIKKFNTQKHSLYNSKSQSDIFFTKKPIKEENEKVNYNQNRRNLSNRSTVFSHCTEKDEIIKKNKNETNYNPDNYYSKDTSFKRLCKQFYESDKNNSNVNISSRGYILNEGERINNPIRRVLSPNRKRIPWDENNSSGVKYINPEDKSGSASKKNRINVQKSNIFFKENNNNIYSDDDIERENYKNKEKSKIERINVKTIDYDKRNINNKNNNNTILKFKKNEMRNYNINEYGNNEKNGFQTDRTDYNTYKAKWEKNLLENKNSDKEMIFPKQNEIETRNIPNWQKKPNVLMESAKIYKTKYQLPKTKTDLNTINYDNRNDLKKIKQVIDSQTDLKEDQKKRFMLNSTTSNLYDKSFYERNMKYKKLQNKEKEHEYILTPEKNKIDKNNLDIISIKKIIREEGLHIYDISSMADNITGNNKEIKFKIRENEGEKYNNHISNIKEQLLNEKGILMEPVKKISVNKKYNPSVENKFFGINQMYVEQNTRKIPKQLYNEKKNKFTNEFNQINMKYKNRGIKSLGVDN